MQGRYVNDMAEDLKTNYSMTNKDVRQLNHKSENIKSIFNTLANLYRC